MPGTLAKLTHVARALVGPWGSYAFRNEIADGLVTLLRLGPYHPFIVSDLDQIAKEGGLAWPWTHEQAFDLFVQQIHLIQSPEDVPNN